MPILVPQLQAGNLARYIRLQRITERELSAILADAADDAERRLLRLADKEGIGAAVRRAQLATASEELRRVVRQLEAGTFDVLRRGIFEASEEGTTGLRLLQEVLTRGIGEIPGLAEAILRQARAGAENVLARTILGVPLSQAVYRTSVLEGQALTRLINQQVAAGSSWRELANAVRRHVEPTTPGGAAYAAKRLARTELNNAFHTSQIRSSLRAPFVEGYLWNLSGSHPKPDVCNEFAGEDHDSLGPGAYIKANVPGKPHPQCLCFLTYITPTVEEFQKRFLDGSYDDYIKQTIGDNAPQFRTQATKAVRVAKTRVQFNPNPKRISDVKLDFAGDSQWQRRLEEPTGRRGIKFDNVELAGLGGKDRYLAKQGYIFRIQDLDVLIEVPDGLFKPIEYAKRQLDAILKEYKKLPVQQRSWLRKVEWAEGRNPGDKYWEKQYGISNFISAATGGNGKMTLWNRVRYGVQELDETFRHEFGHTVDTRFGISVSQEWKDAMKADAAVSRQFREGATQNRPLDSSHAIRLGQAKGLTTYAFSDFKEDVAEAVWLFLDSQKNKGYLGNDFAVKNNKITFAQMFPNRYKILKKYLGAA